MKTLFLVKSILKSLGLKDVAVKAVHLYANIFPNQLVNRNGINYALDLNQLIDFGTFIGGWEGATIDFLNKSLTHGDVVIEVGANVGAHTLLIAKLVGNKGYVYAFEPTEFALNKLRKNISLNPEIENITIRTELVTNGEGNLPKLDVRSSWSVDGQNLPEITTIRNPKAVSIDNFASEVALDRLTLMKIDVDGYDYKVLQGAKFTISRFLPIIFCELCEYSLNEQGDSIKDIFEMLSSMGYEAYLEDGTKVNEVESILRLVGDNTSVNGVFVHKTKVHNHKEFA
jgi:FkbM family methyltransferase